MTTPIPHLSHPKYRPDIDGLRAVAVLSVVAFYAFPGWMKGGFIGVDVFFVISGFLISTIIFENLDKGTFSFSEFYARRIKRIFPALLLVLAVSLAFGWFALLTDEYKQLAKHAMSGIGFVSNLVLWGESGYFDNAAESKPFLHLWSLGIEEQFYFVWPLLCWIFWKLKLRFVSILIVFTIVSFSLNIKVVSSDRVDAFYSPFTRFWELLLGAQLAYMTIYFNSILVSIHRNAYVANGLSFVGLLSLAIGLVLVNKDASFPGYWALIPVIGAVLIILAGPNSFLNRYILANKISVFFGLISFPLYLWHWPLLTFLHIVERGTPDRHLRLTAVVVSVILAWLTYRFIERSVRSSSGNRYVVTLITVSALIFSAGFVIYSQNGFPDRKVVTNSEFSENVQYQFMGPIWAYTKNEICLSEHPYKDQDSLAWWFCMKSTKNPTTILLLGNSYTNQLYPGFVKNPKLSHHTVLSIGTCSVGADGSGNDPRNPCYGNRAKEQTDFIDQIIKSASSLKFVILDGLERTPSSEYIGRVLDRISFLERQGLQVIVFVPHLKPDFHPKACFKSPLKQNSRDCLISSSERQNVLDGFMPLIKAIEESGSNTLVFDQNDVFCDRKDGNCSFVRDGLPLHRDERHTSEYASILLQDYFTEWAKSNVPSIFKSPLKNE